jgi:hypothetical protein
MIESEVSPRQSDLPQLTAWLLRHPIIHFGVTYCYWFTASALLDDIFCQWLALWPPKSHGWDYGFALWMSAIFYYRSRRRMHRFVPGHPNGQVSGETSAPATSAVK